MGSGGGPVPKRSRTNQGFFYPHRTLEKSGSPKRGKKRGNPPPEKARKDKEFWVAQDPELSVPLFQELKNGNRNCRNRVVQELKPELCFAPP